MHRITHTTAFVTPVVEHWLEREISCTRTCPDVNWERIPRHTVVRCLNSGFQLRLHSVDVVIVLRSSQNGNIGKTGELSMSRNL